MGGRAWLGALAGACALGFTAEAQAEIVAPPWCGTP